MAQPIRLRVAEAADQPQGHAVITVEGLAVAPDGVTFALRRAGFGDDNLGPKGWQGPEATLTPDRVDRDGGSLRLHVGPGVVDHMQTGWTLTLLVFAPSLAEPASGEVAWPDIAPSVGGARGGAGRRRRMGAAAPRPDEPAEAGAAGNGTAAGKAAEEENARAAEAQRQQTAEAARKAAAEEGQKRAAAKEAAAKEEEERRQKEKKKTVDGDDRKRSSSQTAIWVAIPAIIAIAAGAYLLWPAPTPPPPPPKPPEPPIAACGGAGQPACEAPPSPPGPTPPAPGPKLSPIELARPLLEGNSSPEELHRKGVEFVAQGEFEAALLLFEKAVDLGYAPAKTALGRMYDPVEFKEGKTPFSKANPGKAAELYRAAKDGGDRDAEAQIEKLKQWLRDAEKNNDPDASRILQTL